MTIYVQLTGRFDAARRGDLAAAVERYGAFTGLPTTWRPAERE